jgi:hypothetical protein
MQTACALLLVCCHLWPVWLYDIFPHYLINVTIFEKKSFSIKFVFLSSLQLLPETLLILRSIRRDTIIIVRRYLLKYPLLLPILRKLGFFSTDVRKILIQNFIKICPMEAELFHADGEKNGQTDVTKINSRSSQFVKRA